MSRSPNGSMMSLEPGITLVTTSHQSTIVVTNVPQSGSLKMISTPRSELWRPRLEELIAFANMVPQNFPLNNHQATLIHINATSTGKPSCRRTNHQPPCNLVHINYTNLYVITTTSTFHKKSTAHNKPTVLNKSTVQNESAICNKSTTYLPIPTLKLLWPNSNTSLTI